MPNLAPTTRFVRRGVTKFRFAATIADINEVIRTEITSSTDLSKEIADVSGWMLENAAASTPDMATTFESSIPGLDSAADSSFTFYEDELGDEIDLLLTKGVSGYVLILRKGDKPGSNSLDVFPVRVGSKGSEYSAGNDAARTVVSFTITDEPALDTEVPESV